MQHRYAGHRRVRCCGPLQGDAVDRVEFEGGRLLPVDHHARPVGAHACSHLQHALDEIRSFDRLRETLLIGGIDYFLHQFSDQLPGFRAVQQPVGRQAGQGTEAVERDVPDQFFPANPGEVCIGLAGDAGLAENFGEPFGPGTEFASKLSDANGALVEVMNRARFAAVAAEKSDAADDLLPVEGGCQNLFIAEAVLQGQDGCLRLRPGGGSGRPAGRWRRP